ncbi:MAG: hypothetical protein A2077_06820 [Nitrospirae bacterium GWC2_46_6]|nr:MAG: hypothetical protein A2Z82_10265 [Nitrospirae bacterium GWA2_46_11]OGW22335.1 MAG: hypothetical protein A2077_06820 [Nitrospirae bacterium GWC2_46_6]OGW23166.1 MAG: hypothetical protein A2X55_09340 [Nitrospirae bacterium GWB2_47_37]HAK87716.1 hypothetical protein [Nitrospiraceae bacterium]HCZ12352.1 hypothetical protein [Nitrospiraceae bacterium]
MKKAVEKRKDIVFYVKLLPIVGVKPDKIGDAACDKYAKMRVEFNGSGKKECDQKEVESTVALAKSLGINGTPTLIMPDGKIYSGNMPADRLIKFIDGRQ